jgi:hypothetical protein
MPNMADITVKKADGTTDIVYVAQSPSAGDNQPAVWRATAAGAAPAFQPELRLWTKSNGPKTARRVYVGFSYPQTATDSTTSVTSVINRALVNGDSAVIPNEFPSTLAAEFSAQYGNLLASTLVKACLASGFAPN